MAYLMGDATGGSMGRLGGFKGGAVAMTASQLASVYTTGQSDDLDFDYKPSAIQLTQWLESDHGKHVVLPDGVRMGKHKTSGKFLGSLSWTTSTDTEHLGADLPILPEDVRVRIVAKASVSAGFDIGDGVDQDYYAAAATIGTGWTEIDVTAFHDGTNREITLTPTSSYSGTVDVCVLIEALV